VMRLPDYESGRFFISPILGCNAQCSYCYIYDNGYKNRIRHNQCSILDSLEFIKSHKNYSAGEDGSIISIGAWGDPFPRYSKKAQQYSLMWLKEACKLGNPIQIMSRYGLLDEVIDEIAKLGNNSNQILYSTSITTIIKYRLIEPYADAPEERIRSLEKLQAKGVQVNVMIKPFIEGITDLELDEIEALLKKGNIENCVVGGFYTSESILKRISSVLPTNYETGQKIEVLDCTSKKQYSIAKPDVMLDFTNQLNERGIRAFRKSSCVTSFIAKKENPAGYFTHDPYNYCIKCGVCYK
jgi:DNA repair photolyase